MGYAALLFCPDDKTARTVTQVLSELEFAVETCTEPFAAVKKLMSQHFDAVVVDCDNEQNATLVFKSARNSTSNQTSLAVAVVEGQAGVAKAFRIGANLVLTKPINIEQAKGTVRVARGLLRKGEPAKPGALATSAAAPSKPAASKTVPESKTAETTPSAWPVSPEGPTVPSQTAMSAAVPTVIAGSKPTAHDDDLLGIDGDVPQKAPAASAFEAKTAPGVSSQPMMGSAAASAPAPARDRREWDLFEKPASTAGVAEKTLEPAKTESPGIVGSAPSFTFGGAAAENESEGGSKKTFVRIAAALVLAGGLYFGWSHIHSSADQGTPANPISSPSPTTATSSTQTAAKEPLKAPPLSGKPSASLPSTAESIPSGSSDTKHRKDENAPEDDLNSEPTTSSKADSEKLEPAPLIVKGGQTASHPKGGTDAAPPSVIGLATPGTGAPPTDLIQAPTPSLRPSLQALNISQGVSQGLLIKKVAPVYPQTALRMRIEGSVDLLATISKTGEITHIKIVSGDAQLSKAATDAVKQWKYKPYLLNGEPVEIQTQITVNFKLPR